MPDAPTTVGVVRWGWVACVACILACRVEPAPSPAVIEAERWSRLADALAGHGATVTHAVDEQGAPTLRIGHAPPLARP